jgi:ribose transport system substrate-binding protein
MNKSYRWLAAAGAMSAIALVATGCSPAAPAEEEITIAFVMGAESDPFFQAMKVGAEEEAAAQGVTLVWQGDPSNYSAETQIPIVDAVLAEQPTALVLIPTDPTALQASVDKAVAAGIIVANVDTHVDDLTDVLTFITGDNEDGGAKAADALAAKIGYEDGGSYEVVVGLTSPTATTNVGRLDGFTAQVEANYPGIAIVDVAYSESNPEKAATNVNNWLTKYPGLDGIYDAYPDNVAKIKSGIFTALIAQDPAAEARLAIKTIVEFIKTGETSTPREVVIPNVTLDANTSDADFAKYTYVAN